MVVGFKPVSDEAYALPRKGAANAAPLEVPPLSGDCSSAPCGSRVKFPA
jgi:hypothetical protein